MQRERTVRGPAASVSAPVRDGRWVQGGAFAAADDLRVTGERDVLRRRQPHAGGCAQVHEQLSKSREVQAHHGQAARQVRQEKGEAGEQADEEG